ncbi:PVC-type heme-binding CxxCH protein [Planctomicrobium sp. SH668]|uniref:PVC-type heme-binding CxxCH protein n=1 Tax=Planctomicrobium sp. SH668 TaxID=3448126 RepID=UPI003F5C435D
MELRFSRAILRHVFALLAMTTSVLAEEFVLPPNTEKSTTTPMDPAEVVKTAQVPPGFSLSVIASEPHVQNPIAMTTDEKGRLWIAENYSWSGNGEGGFNSSLKDRIVILEDSDGDGSYDKRTVFWDQARNLTSIEVGNGGVWAISLPELIFIPDADRDDVPDSEPQVILDGLIVGLTGHTPANGLKWGPDGWLYGRHGILATSMIGKPGASESQRFAINTGVWRYHPQRQVGEAVMHGMTNPWGFDYDQNGEMFVINTVIGHLWHVIPGGHTERMFGLDIEPHSYRLLEQTADHVHWNTSENWHDVNKGITDGTSAAGGGHAHIGLMIYQGDNWPEEYRNRVYTLNLHGMRLNSDILARDGAGFTATHGPDLCFVQDSWFRGMELLTGPDGTVLIADWSDTGECHDHDGVHRSSGRIYRLAYGNPAPTPKFDLKTKSDQELIDLLNHPNAWWARQARRLLVERTHGEQPKTEAAQLVSGLESLLAKTNDHVHRIRILETIGSVGGSSAQFWIDRFAAENESERVMALKFLVDQAITPDERTAASVTDALENLAKKEPSGLIQLHLASSLQRLSFDERWRIASLLVARPEFCHDKRLQLMVWYGILDAVPVSPERAIALLQISKMPLVTECVVRRLSLSIEEQPEVVEQVLAFVADGKIPLEASVVHGMSLALNGWLNAIPPESWAAVSKKFSGADNQQLKSDLQALNLVFGDGRALDELKTLVADGMAPATTRQQALRALAKARPEGYSQTLLNLLDDRALRKEALLALAYYDDPNTPAWALARLDSFDPAERSAMIQTLTSRPLFAKALLEAVQAKRMAASELSAFHARQIASFNDESLTKLLTDVWGELRASPAEKKALIEAQKEKLTEAVLAEADLSQGRALYQKTCVNCHILYGNGRRVGPDLTGSNRKNLDYLLENIVDPSSSVGVDFRTVVVALEDGRVLNGVISEQNDRTITLQSAQEAITIDRREIEEMKATTVSLMPDGLLQNLSEEQIRDLIAYLMGSEQVPLPAE